MVTKYALKNYNKDRDVEGSESNGKDSSEDDGEDNNKDNGKDKEFQDKIDIDLDKPAKTLYYKHVTLILLYCRPSAYCLRCVPYLLSISAFMCTIGPSIPDSTAHMPPSVTISVLSQCSI